MKQKSIPFVKMQGSSNDILLVPGMPSQHFANDDDCLNYVRLVCDRKGPLGGDGVYFFDDQAEVRALFFNPDGSQVELCANGLRCLGRLVMDRRGIDTIRIKSGTFNVEARVIPSECSQWPVQVAVDLPAVSFNAGDVLTQPEMNEYVGHQFHQLSEELSFTVVAVPNANIVAVVNTFSEAALRTVESNLRKRMDKFHHGVNVSFIKPFSNTEIFVRTYERGAGLTQSCGSASVASRAVFSKLGMARPEERVLIRNVGGPSTSFLRVKGDVWMPTLEGNATYVFRGELSLGDLAKSGLTFHQYEVYLNEIMAYEEVWSKNDERLRDSGLIK
jgi:diaminopimelate epimerase